MFCIVLEVACLVTALMLFTLFLVRIVETSMYVELLILRLDLEYSNMTSRRKTTGVVLLDVLTENAVIVAILTYFSKQRWKNLCKVMLNWKVTNWKERNIGNVSFSLIHMVWTAFLTCIQVKEKVTGKTDSTDSYLCNFNTLFT